MHLNGRQQEAEWANGGNDYLMELPHSMKHTGSPREADRKETGRKISLGLQPCSFFLIMFY